MMNMKSLKIFIYIITILMVLGFIQVQSSFASESKCEYEYDKLNRLVKVTYGDGSYVEYKYDANGNLIEVHTVNKSEKPASTKNPDNDNSNKNDSDKGNSGNSGDSDNKDNGANYIKIK